MNEKDQVLDTKPPVDPPQDKIVIDKLLKLEVDKRNRWAREQAQRESERRLAKKKKAKQKQVKKSRAINRKKG